MHRYCNFHFRSPTSTLKVQAFIPAAKMNSVLPHLLQSVEQSRKPSDSAIANLRVQLPDIKPQLYFQRINLQTQAFCHR
jgi:hypothetical protein